MHPRSPSLLLTALAAGAAGANPSSSTSSCTTVTVPPCPGTSYGITLSSFLSYSIEFSSFVNYAGNLSNPNDFSYNLLSNIGNLTGSNPLIRVGGNTQDYALFNASQTQAVIETFVPSISKDYPRYLTIGPSFYDSFHTWPGTRYIYGFNLAANGTSGRASLLATAKYACRSLADVLAYWELGNEPDLYSTSAQGARRPLSWDSAEYVSQWLNGTEAIRQVIAEYCPDLATAERYKYYAPSFAGTDNHLNPVVTWADGLDRNKDIAIISSHNYIGGATQPGVTLQHTLMNHTSIVDSVAAQINESTHIAALGPRLDPGLPFILGETNSLYNEGAPGLSNSFGAALWAVDFAVYCAAKNISRVHFHQGLNYRYQSWQPEETNITTKGTKAPYYGNVVAAAFVGDDRPAIVNLPLEEETRSAYAAYVDRKVRRVLLVDMLEYNSTAPEEDAYPRPVFEYEVRLPGECEGCKVGVRRLVANGSDAISGISWDGYSYNYELENGKPVRLGNVTVGEEVVVKDGVAAVSLVASQAVILDLTCS